MIDNYFSRNFDLFTEEDSYAKATFEIKVKSSKEYGGHILSSAGRIRNNVVRAINDYVSLPKFIMIIPEYDVLRKIDTRNLSEKEVRNICFKIIRWLINEVRKLIAAHNDFLPKRAKSCVDTAYSTSKLLQF